MRNLHSKYGQHFLINENIISQIVHAAVSLKEESVVEIGPGKGALTLSLIRAGLTEFTVSEIDPDMIAFLKQTLPPQAGVRILPGDFLKTDLNALPAAPTEFVSNLPYIDAAAILDKALSFPYFRSAVFMFQKEQANRIQAKAGGDFYGPLSILSQARAEVSLLCNVSRGCFNPPPKVQSAVLVFKKLAEPAVADASWPAFKKLVTAAFLHRRKTLYNSLVLAGYEKSRVQNALAQAGVSAQFRPEQLDLPGYVRLTEALTRAV